MLSKTETTQHLKVLMQKKLKSPTLMKTTQDAHTQKLQTHAQNEDVQNKILVDRTGSQPTAGNKIVISQPQPQSVTENEVFNGDISEKTNSVASLKSSPNNVFLIPQNSKERDLRTDNHETIHPYPIECIEVSDDDFDFYVNDQKFSNNTVQGNTASLKKVTALNNLEYLNRNVTRDITATISKNENEDETTNSCICTVCYTIFPNYLQCASHKMAAHGREVKTIASHESEESYSEVEYSSTSSEEYKPVRKKKRFRRRNIVSDSDDESQSWWDKDGNPQENKEFECSVCSTQFSNFISLAAHGMAAHKKVYYNSNASKIKTASNEHQNVSDSYKKEQLKVTLINKQDSGSLINKQDSGSLINKKDSGILGDKQESVVVFSNQQSHNLVNKQQTSSLLNKQQFNTSVDKQHFVESLVDKQQFNILDNRQFEKLSCVPIYLNGNEDGSVPDKENQTKECPACRKQLIKSDFETHLKFHPEVCPICYKVIPDGEEYENHKLSHSNDYLCETCGKSFPSNFLLKVHITRCHSEKQVSQKRKKVTCRTCLAAFRTRNDLRRHRLQKHYMWKNCPVCNKVYNESYLKQHLKLTHSLVRPFPCDLCGRTYKNKEVLRVHLKSHSSSKAIRGDWTHDSKQCEKCGKCFKSVIIMKRHLKKVCCSNSTICDKCGLVLETRELLRKHCLEHRDLKPFKCKFCDKCFRYRRAKVAHECKHTGERPFVCEICDRGYRDKETLVRHSAIHLNLKPFVCDYCNKALPSKTHIRTHLLSHNEFKCSICSRIIFRYDNFKKHLQTHLPRLPGTE